MQKPYFGQFLNFLLGSKDKPYQYTHHAVLLVGGFGYLACSLFNYILQTSDVILAFVQAGLFLAIMLIWYLSRWHDQYRTMALVFMFLMVLFALPVNWIYNGGVTGPTYFLNLCTLVYISIAYRDFGFFRLLGQLLVILVPVLMPWFDLNHPEWIYYHPSDFLQAVDLAFSYVVTAVLLIVMMGRYSRRYQLERDKAERLAAQLRDLSEQDTLTGLSNRRGMDRFFQNLQSRSQQQSKEGSGYCLAIIDLDHFKKLNDRWGHSYGDQVLRLFSGLLLALAQQHQGMAVRLGGEEFVLLLPLPHDDALECLQSLASRTADLPLEHEPVTFSAGLVSDNGSTAQDDLLRAADQLLYDAKAAGRNRILSRRPTVMER